MAMSKTVLFKNSANHWKRADIKNISPSTRGIYILYLETTKNMNVQYIGISFGQSAGVRSRIYNHARSKPNWTHFSIYEVWDNISDQHIKELEGLFLQIYAEDEHANVLNVAKGHRSLEGIRRASSGEWIVSTERQKVSGAGKGRTKQCA